MCLQDFSCSLFTHPQRTSQTKQAMHQKKKKSLWKQAKYRRHHPLCSRSCSLSAVLCETMFKMVQSRFRVQLKIVCVPVWSLTFYKNPLNDEFVQLDWKCFRGTYYIYSYYSSFLNNDHFDLNFFFIFMLLKSSMCNANISMF